MRRALYWIYLLAGIHITYMSSKDALVQLADFDYR